MGREVTLTDKKFAEIYTDESFRNEVAGAHRAFDSSHKFKHFQTCSYPITYIVTKEQIEEAVIERAKSKALHIESYKNKLAFVSMGGDREPQYVDDIANFRVRTHFFNDYGRKFFIEAATMCDKKTICITFSIDEDLRYKMERVTSDLMEKLSKIPKTGGNWPKIDTLRTEVRESQRQPYYNYKGLERNRSLGDYTKTNLINIVNEYFDCSFKEIIIDKYNLGCDDIVCQSPNYKIKS